MSEEITDSNVVTEQTQEITTENTGKKPKRSHSFAWGLLTGLLAATVIFLGVFVVRTIYNKATIGQAISSSSLVDESVVKKADLIKNVIDKYYYGEYDTEAMKEGFYDGMVEALGDQYSTYYSAEELKEINKGIEGIFYGIGAYIIEDDSGMCAISGVMEDSPAEAAGIEAGDKIYMIDGVSAKGMDSSEVVSLIRGEEGTVVHLTLIRTGVDSKVEVDVTRGRVETQTVGYSMLDDNIGYIQITTFDTVTADQFLDALVTLKGNGARGFIMDVRNNTGGSLDTVCEMLRHILPEGVIVYTEDKNGNRSEELCDGTDELDLPLVVLCNGYSASASEIFTGAIKDYHKGTIVGTTTFGKGVVQRIINLSDGSAVKLTISSYFTPSGVCIQGTGIKPDIEVDLDYDYYLETGKEKQLEAAIEEIHRQWEEAE